MHIFTLYQETCLNMEEIGQVVSEELRLQGTNEGWTHQSFVTWRLIT